VSANRAFHAPSIEALNVRASAETGPLSRIAGGWLRTLAGRIGKGLQPSARGLCIEERLSLGGKKSVTLIACHGRRFLLASSGDSIAPLLEVRPLRNQPDPPRNEE
jgi:hypothetical protein